MEKEQEDGFEMEKEQEDNGEYTVSGWINLERKI